MATSAKTIDFSKVKDGGGSFNRNRIPAGDYAATVIKVEDAPSKKDDVFQYLFTIQVDKYPTRKLPYYCKLQENQLWKLRNLLIAAGLSVPKARVKVDPNKVVGRKIGITVEDEEYDGKEQSGVAAVFPVAELVDGDQVDDGEEFVDDEGDEDTDLDDLTAGDEDEDEDEALASPFADLDRAALKAEIKKFKPEFQAKKSQTDDDLRDILVDLTADATPTEDEEDEEEPEPEPAPKASRKKKATKPAPSDEDLDELDIDDL